MPDVILKHVPAMATARPVPVHDAGSLSEKRFLEEHVGTSRPCVIRGAVRHWPAMEKWRDLEYLKTRYGQAVNFFPHENHVSVKRAASGQRILAFAEAVALAQTADVAAFGTALPSPLDGDLGGFSFFGGGEPGFLYPLYRTFFFRNAGSSWHYHPFDETLMCQVMAPKRIGLLAVANPFHRYLRRIFYKEDYYDHAFAFEGLKAPELEWLCASLEAGDALYIPPLWWHGVIATSENFGATVPVVWRSPAPVVADAIRKMAAGEVDLLGELTSSQLQRLLEFARGAGLEAQMQTAWQRGASERLVSLAS